MKALLLLASLSWAIGESLPIESFDKPGSVQAVQQAFDDKFSVRGGTISGQSSFISPTVMSSSLTVRSSGADIILSTSTLSDSFLIRGTDGGVVISSGVSIGGSASIGSGSLNLTGSLYGNGIKGMVLGGVYCVATGTTATGSNNPLTSAQSCPSGYSSYTLFNTGGIKNMSDEQQTITCTLCYRSP